MPRVVFAPALQRHVAVPARQVPGATVRAALEAVFREHERLQGYVLDDQGSLRRHVAVFVDGRLLTDRSLRVPVGEGAEIYVAQALSGG